MNCSNMDFTREYDEYLEQSLYGLADLAAAEEIGVMKLRRQPYLNLYGKDVIVGFVDTGIEYTHVVFRKSDNTSKILEIWDQESDMIYTKSQIDAALLNDNPQSIVPETDGNGHGTFAAGIVAGSSVESEAFTGIAPQAELLVVKLKEASDCAREFWFIPDGVPAYEEQDIIDGVQYCIEAARRYNKPLVLYIGLSSNRGDHNGAGFFSNLLNTFSLQKGAAVVIAGGNEGNVGHHFRGLSQPGEAYQDVELRVGEGESGFYVEFWAEAPDVYGIGFISPTGEYIQKLPTHNEYRQTISFAFEPTLIYVTYQKVEPDTGELRIIMRFANPVPGIWKIRIFQEDVIGGRFDLWLPISNFLSSATYFLKPDPDTTITTPGNALMCMTVSAYDQATGGIYLNSSRGFTREGEIKPDFAAPGVNIKGPVKGGLFAARTGSSVATAFGTGIAALMMEYNPRYTGVQVAKFLIRGAIRGDMMYPNPEWGYGKVNIYRTFESMRVSL